MFRTGISFERVGEEGVVVDIDTNKVITLNHTGSDIAEILLGGASIEDAVLHISTKYGVDQAIVRKDVAELLETLVEHGVWTS